jgi:hypothetical protein
VRLVTTEEEKEKSSQLKMVRGPCVMVPIQRDIQFDTQVTFYTVLSMHTDNLSPVHLASLGYIGMYGIGVTWRFDATKE